jgi:hypothetical protein
MYITANRATTLIDAYIKQRSEGNLGAALHVAAEIMASREEFTGIMVLAHRNMAATARVNAVEAIYDGDRDRGHWYTTQAVIYDELADLMAGRSSRLAGA